VRPFRSPLVALAAMALLLLSIPGCSDGLQPTGTLVPTLAPLTVDPENPVIPSSTAASLQPSDPSYTDPPPEVTPIPSTLPSTPAPIPVWLDEGLPGRLSQAAAAWIAAQPGRYALTGERASAEVALGSTVAGGTPVANWVYALVAPFPTLEDGVSWDELRGAWMGNPAGVFAGRPLLVSAETGAVLTGLLGEPALGTVVTVPEGELLDRAWAAQPTFAWAVVPFEALEPRWKVLRLDGLSPLDRGLDLDAYPLVVRLSAAGPGETLEPLLSAADLPTTNRDESHMTRVVMTGVTALTRATAWRMEQKGLTYPAQDVGDWLRAADITHVSNEVAFDPECGPPNPVQEGLLFCSDPRYIELLEHISVDVVEMTGNHIADAGVEHVEPTLDMYVERGWQYFGGGRNLEDARQPAVFQHNGNVIAFLGCNPTGPPSVWATPERAGAAPCDYELLYAQLAELRAQGALPIVTLQYWEEDRYDPTPQQIADFQALIEAGAAIVSGSHAHHAQGFGFHQGSLIHYGVGNLFFDQMELMGNRQEFIDRHVFYGGRHISTEVLTALLEDWSRPRPMTEQERLELLQTVFAVSVWE
jgi:hypothetical protein